MIYKTLAVNNLIAASRACIPAEAEAYRITAANYMVLWFFKSVN